MPFSWPTDDNETRFFIGIFLCFLDVVTNDNTDDFFQAFQDAWHREETETSIFSCAGQDFPDQTPSGGKVDRLVLRLACFKIAGHDRIGELKFLIADKGRAYFIRQLLAHLPPKSVIKIAPLFSWDPQADAGYDDAAWQQYLDEPVRRHKGLWKQRRIEMRQYAKAQTNKAAAAERRADINNHPAPAAPASPTKRQAIRRQFFDSQERHGRMARQLLSATPARRVRTAVAVAVPATPPAPPKPTEVAILTTSIDRIAKQVAVLTDLVVKQRNTAASSSSSSSSASSSSSPSSSSPFSDAASDTTEPYQPEDLDGMLNELDDLQTPPRPQSVPLRPRLCPKRPARLNFDSDSDSDSGSVPAGVPRHGPPCDSNSNKGKNVTRGYFAAAMAGHALKHAREEPSRSFTRTARRAPPT